MNFFEKEIKVRLTFIEEILGSSPASQEIYREYIASKAPDAPTIEDEIAAVGVDETADAKMTVFPRQNGVPGVWDYQVKGFFKDSCGGLGRVKRTLSGGLKAYKKVIDKLVFVEERFIPYEFGGKMGVCERPPPRSDSTGRTSSTLRIGINPRRSADRVYYRTSRRKA